MIASTVHFFVKSKIMYIFMVKYQVVVPEVPQVFSVHQLLRLYMKKRHTDNILHKLLKMVI